MLSRDDIVFIMPHAGFHADSFLEPLVAATDEFEINSPERQAAFLAQIADESGEMLRVSENLNYSASGLIKTWPRHFNPAEAAEYEHQPERIANRAYADRDGNGDEASGDGWLYRGAGLIQLTGKENHQKCADAFGMPLEGFGDYLRSPEGACRSAAWLWHSRGLNELADAGDFIRITKRINGGLIGEPTREAYWKQAKKRLGVA